MSERLRYVKGSASSAREYGRRVVGHWAAFSIGLLLAAVGTIQVVLTDLQFAWWVWLVAAFLALVLAQFLAFHDVRLLRDEALVEQERFPDVDIDIESSFCVEHRQEATPAAALVALIFEVRIVNRDRARRLSLSFDLALVEETGAPDTAPVAVRLLPTRQTLRTRYEKELLPEIVVVDPARTVSGYLSFDYTSSAPGADPSIELKDWGEPDDGLPITFEPREGHHFDLTIHDFGSGKSITLDVPGRYPSTRPEPATPSPAP